MNSPLFTPDGRYLIVRGRLWRAANPHLSEGERKSLVAELMAARSALGRAIKAGEDRKEARRRIQAAKEGLGERGPIWWTDGAPDYNRRLARNTPYADWYATQEQT
jgi:hypothetical protein